MVNVLSELIKDKSVNLLLGNGFSINLYPKFNYKSLYELGMNNSYLLKEEQQLFNDFNTKNFEEILLYLNNAKYVNDILKINDSGIISKHYNNIKESLIKIIYEIHPNYSDLNTVMVTEIGKWLSNFNIIFTTNYDLMLYWIFMEYNNKVNKSFADLFFQDGTFDLNYSLYSGVKPILYIHGALHIAYYNGNTFKIKNQDNDNLLNIIESFINSNNVPLFVSEGTHEKKLIEIKNNQYLTHCYHCLQKSNKDLVVYGISFCDSDKHIIKAINENQNISNIYYSIYLPNYPSEDDIIAEQNRIKKLFTGKSIILYDSNIFMSKYSDRTAFNDPVEKANFEIQSPFPFDRKIFPV